VRILQHPLIFTLAPLALSYHALSLFTHPIFGRIQVYFSCKGKVISNQKIHLYVYNNISYETVPIRNFRLMANNVNFVKWKWNTVEPFCYWQWTPWLLFYVYKNTTQNTPWIRKTNILYLRTRTVCDVSTTNFKFRFKK